MCEGKDKGKQASGSDSMGLHCRMAYLVASRGALVHQTQATPHDLDDLDPQCHLIRTPTHDEAFPPASWPSYTRLDRDAVSSLNWMVRAGVAGSGLAGGNRWPAPRKLVDPSRYGYLVPVGPPVPEPSASPSV